MRIFTASRHLHPLKFVVALAAVLTLLAGPAHADDGSICVVVSGERVCVDY